MYIQKAIEILEAACNHEERFNEEELWDAQKLGIEALKVYTGLRYTLDIHAHQLLKGETKN